MRSLIICLFILLALPGAGTLLAQSKNVTGQSSKTKGAPGANKFTLQMQANAECNLFINDENKGLLKLGEQKLIYLNLGVNKISARPTGNEFSVFNTTYDVAQSELNKENTITLELARKADPEKAEDKPNWFFRALTNIIEKRKLSW